MTNRDVFEPGRPDAFDVLHRSVATLLKDARLPQPCGQILYAARYVAKNIVAAGLADRCEVQVSYAIGVAEPTSIMVETFGTSRLSRERLTQLVRKHFDLTPYGLREMLDLVRPIYQKTAAYGHFGRTESEFSWEGTDKAAELADEAKGAAKKAA